MFDIYLKVIDVFIRKCVFIYVKYFKKINFNGNHI